MQLLEQRIMKDCKVLPGSVLKVDMFLNHLIDVDLLNEIGKEFKRLYNDCEINKILTIEASGIGIACIAAQYFSVPVLFAKKGAHKNIGNDLYVSKVHSYTKDTTYEIAVSKQYLTPDDKVLIIDDFLANGQAILGLKDLIEQAGATLVGAGIVIEKGFQPGGQLVRDAGIRVESLAIIDSMEDKESLTFRH